MREITVTTGGMEVGGADTRLKTGGIGSCVVIVLYDAQARVGGLAHAMLPRRTAPDRHQLDEPPAKYADESVDRLIERIEAAGGRRRRLKARLVGGAQMFALFSDRESIGHENVESARGRLLGASIPIEGEETGGTGGRMVDLNLATGALEIITKI